MFLESYKDLDTSNQRWNELQVKDSDTFNWSDDSTYIHEPPFFQNLSKDNKPVENIKDAYCLLNLGDSITTDHISPAGKIALKSPASQYLQDRGVKPIDFNSYGSRRGNDEVMVRGTFANVRLINKMADKTGPYALHVPTNEQRSVYEVANEY